MQVSLIKKNRIYTTTLPKNIYGNYWITDKDYQNNERNLINIEEVNGNWIAKSNIDNKLIENNTIVPEVVISDYSFNYLKIGQNSELAIIYSAPVYDETFEAYTINKEIDIFIGSGPLANLKYQIPSVSQQHAKLTRRNNMWLIEDMNSQFGVYVNNERILQKKLEIGDVVFIMGLKIIPMGNYLLCNKPFSKVELDKEIFIPYPLPNNQAYTPETEELEIELYENKDYFFRAPRFQPTIVRETVVIDPPPGKDNMQEMPLIYMLGPMLTMGMTSMVSAYTALNGVLEGSKSLESALPALIIAFAMLMGTLGWPMLSKRFNKKQKRIREKERQNKYRQYIDSKEQQIEIIMKKQAVILNENYVSTKDCEDIILNKTRKLWERKTEHADFLTVRLGIGNILPNIDIRYPEEHFSMEDDNLREILNSLVYKAKEIANVPIGFNFTEKHISALVGQYNNIHQFVTHLILQIVTFHSYEDVKLIIFTNEETEKDWDYLKALPHLWSNDRTIRFFASNYSQMSEISSYLEQDLSNRINDERGSLDYRSFTPYYIIITDDYRIAQNIDIVKKVLNQKRNIGFNLFVMNDSLSTLPNECTTFINIKDKLGGLFESELVSDKQKSFRIDDYSLPHLNTAIMTLANIPIKLMKGNYSFPNVITFLDLYNIGKIEQLNTLFRWNNNTTTNSLQAPIGVDSNGMTFKLDMHEKAHGPHGLIAGMTGSGKSEFIITYILSLAVNYHPNEVSFILIDYKGGGLAGAFQNDELNIKLPHLAGTITNLDTIELNRSLVSIESELRRRQEIFNRTRELLAESTIDIYKYQRLYRDGVVKEPMSHLFIICDEFAELKVGQPEFMDQLISTARIGRSLGIHLILATQKPSGVVNDQIWSNSRLHVCLKVQEKSDSNDMIKRPDAALLKNVGRFYLQVGYDELFILGQAAWAGAQYLNSAKIKKKVSHTIDYIDNLGNITKEIGEPIKSEVTVNMGDQLSNIVKYLSEIATNERIYTKPLWLDRIPDNIYILDLAKKYKYQYQKGIINPIIGEYDDPSNQKQGLLTLPLTTEGNTLIYGAPGSGKDMLLSTIIYSTILCHNASEVNFYIIDFGAEFTKSYSNAPQIGDILLIDDIDKIDNLFKMLRKEIDYRKKILVPYSGQFTIYREKAPNPLPTLIIVINNYVAFTESYDNYNDTIVGLTREGYKCGIVFIIISTSANGVRYKLEQNFKQKIVLQLNDNQDYNSILGNVKGVFPSKVRGRGIVRFDSVHEFQTASISSEDTLVEQIKNTCDKLKDNSTVNAPHVPILPQIVSLDFVKDSLNSLKTVPIGVEKMSLDIGTFDFNPFMSTISGQDLYDMRMFINGLAKEINSLDNDNFIIDAEALINMDNESYYNDNMNEIFEKLLDSVSKDYELYKNNNYNASILSNQKDKVCFIVGIDKFRIKLSNDNQTKYESLFEMGKDLQKYHFILIDRFDKFKKVEYEPWYRSNVNQSNGIWIGDGIADQYVFKISRISRELYATIGNKFGYVIVKGQPTLVKVIED